MPTPQLRCLVPQEIITRKILFIRGMKVMLDKDLAELYQVPVKVLNQAVKRNKERFPLDFMFQLTDNEAKHLRSQFVTANVSAKSRSRPYVFTDYGALQLSSVIRSTVATNVSIGIIKAFARLRELLSVNKDIRKKIEQLEQRSSLHDHKIGIIWGNIYKLLHEPKTRKKQIGFRPNAR
ncbi:MAG: ORF6N domain-containing protein [Candidatus Margulisiibacteriota bacterium]|jgi:hypothetical protein